MKAHFVLAVAFLLGFLVPTPVKANFGAPPNIVSNQEIINMILSSNELFIRAEIIRGKYTLHDQRAFQEVMQSAGPGFNNIAQRFTRVQTLQNTAALSFYIQGLQKASIKVWRDWQMAGFRFDPRRFTESLTNLNFSFQHAITSTRILQEVIKRNYVIANAHNPIRDQQELAVLVQNLELLNRATVRTWHAMMRLNQMYRHAGLRQIPYSFAGTFGAQYRIDGFGGNAWSPTEPCDIQGFLNPLAGRMNVRYQNFDYNINGLMPLQLTPFSLNYFSGVDAPYPLALHSPEKIDGFLRLQQLIVATNALWLNAELQLHRYMPANFYARKADMLYIAMTRATRMYMDWANREVVVPGGLRGINFLHVDFNELTFYIREGVFAKGHHLGGINCGILDQLVQRTLWAMHQVRCYINFGIPQIAYGPNQYLSPELTYWPQYQQGVEGFGPRDPRINSQLQAGVALQQYGNVSPVPFDPNASFPEVGASPDQYLNYQYDPSQYQGLGTGDPGVPVTQPGMPLPRGPQFSGSVPYAQTDAAPYGGGNFQGYGPQQQQAYGPQQQYQGYGSQYPQQYQGYGGNVSQQQMDPQSQYSQQQFPQQYSQQQYPGQYSQQQFPGQQFSGQQGQQQAYGSAQQQQQQPAEQIDPKLAPRPTDENYQQKWEKSASDNS